MNKEDKTIDKVKVMILDLLMLNSTDPRHSTRGLADSIVNQAYNAGYEIEAFDELCEKMKRDFRKAME